MIDLETNGQLNTCRLSDNLNQPIIGITTYTQVVLRRQKEVCDEEIGDSMEIDEELILKARAESCITIDVMKEGDLLSSLEECLRVRYLGYCNPKTCLNNEEMTNFIGE